jgi:hypothetical protein
MIFCKVIYPIVSPLDVPMEILHYIPVDNMVMVGDIVIDIVKKLMMIIVKDNIVVFVLMNMNVGMDVCVVVVNIKMMMKMIMMWMWMMIYGKDVNAGDDSVVFVKGNDNVNALIVGCGVFVLLLLLLLLLLLFNSFEEDDEDIVNAVDNGKVMGVIVFVVVTQWVIPVVIY